MIPDLLLTVALHAGERHANPTDAEIVAAAAKVPGRWRAFARCIIARESHGNPRARNPHSSAQGKHQWLDHSWRSPLAYMVAARLKDYGYANRKARTLRMRLQVTPIAAWPEAMQDVGFAAVISVPGGSRHWALAGSSCEAYR